MLPRCLVQAWHENCSSQLTKGNSTGHMPTQIRVHRTLIGTWAPGVFSLILLTICTHWILVDSWESAVGPATMTGQAEHSVA